MKRRFFIALGCMASALSSAHAASLLATSGVFGFGGPPQLQSVTTSPPSVSPPVPLGDGSVFFEGGMTAGPEGAVYAIGDHSVCSGGGCNIDSSSLYTIQPTGAISLVGTLDPSKAINGGLTYDPANGTFYGFESISGDFSCVTMGIGPNCSQLYAITLNGAGSVGSVNLIETFPGIFQDIAFDTANGQFYGLDSPDPSSLFLYLDQFDLSGHDTHAAFLGTEADILHGLTYDPAINAFWSIQHGPTVADSQLIQMSPSGGTSSPLLALQAWSEELALVPAATRDTPEPAVPATLGAGLILIGLLGAKNKKG
jgi:hypothetical protein